MVIQHTIIMMKIPLHIRKTIIHKQHILRGQEPIFLSPRKNYPKKRKPQPPSFLHPTIIASQSILGPPLSTTDASNHLPPPPLVADPNVNFFFFPSFRSSSSPLLHSFDGCCSSFHHNLHRQATIADISNHLPLTPQLLLCRQSSCPKCQILVSFLSLITLSCPSPYLFFFHKKDCGASCVICLSKFRSPYEGFLSVLFGLGGRMNIHLLAGFDKKGQLVFQEMVRDFLSKFDKLRNLNF